jgi:hypothetical protein
MTKTIQTAVLAAFAMAPAGLAETAATTAAAPQLSPTEQKIQEIKHPAKWFSWGGDFRLRNEYFDELLTLTRDPALNPNAWLHEQDYFRFRARVWGAFTPVDDLSLNTRLATEPREWMKPAGFTVYKGNSGWDWSEGVVDTLNVQYRNVAGLPANLTVGRQDIFLGDGWLLGEGTPGDGSWTFFLDSARLTINLTESKTTIDVIGIIQDAKDDGWMPVLNEQHRFFTEQNEKGAVLWVANKSVPAVNVDGYFFYKHDDKASANGPTAAPRGGDNADIYTLGLRLSGPITERLKYSVEGAYQFGEKQDTFIQYPSTSTEYRDLSAFGANTKLTYALKDRLNNQFFLAYEFLSGDDPETQGDEMFDVLWGRWPRWGEIGLYGYAAETRIGQAANLHRLGPGWTISPAKNLDFTAQYYALFAQHEIPTREAAPTLFSHTDNFRGHFISAVLKYKFSPHMSGHLWGEVLLPGNYYVTDSVMPFLRAELLFTF